MLKALIVFVGIMLAIFGILKILGISSRARTTQLSKQGVVVISCWFGTSTDIAAAPVSSSVRAIFLTNNPTLTQLISSRGWEVVLTTDQIHARDVSPLDADNKQTIPSGQPGKSSLQSKQVKFLCFPEEHRHIIQNYQTIIYMDHKRIVDDIDHLLKFHTSDILLRYDKKMKTIDREIQIANFQKRYSASMPGTIRWIQGELQSLGKKPSDIRICNTGVIVYQNNERVLKFIKEVYDNCVALRQPECQLIWATLAARSNTPAIRTIEYKDVKTRPIMW